MDNDKIIWNFLDSRGFNDYAKAGIMGNMKAESGLRSNNLQGSYEKAFNLTDEEYTDKVDKNIYTNFVHDGAGYGLCQWTYWSRKASLYNWCKTNKCSIGDVYMQLSFFFIELVCSYTSVYKKLQTVTSVREASDLILLKFEKPKDQSEKVQIKRAEYAQKYFDKFSKLKDTEITIPSIDDIAKDVIAGKYGVGAERKQKLTNAGYDYETVQSRVNEILRKEN